MSSETNAQCGQPEWGTNALTGVGVRRPVNLAQMHVRPVNQSGGCFCARLTGRTPTFVERDPRHRLLRLEDETQRIQKARKEDETKQAPHYDDVVFCTLDEQTKYAWTGVGYSRALVKEG